VRIEHAYGLRKRGVYWLKPVVVVPNGVVSAELPAKLGVLAPTAGMERLIPNE
jgi:hypothetical protein